MSLRDDIVNNARWGAANEPRIHYTQAAGRMDAVHTPRKLPLYTDCSGFVTFCYSWAGAPDPNGRHYNGTGFTGSLLDHLEHISKDELKPGDIVVFGPYPGDHVVIVVEEGADPLTVSHGQEKGPILIRLSREVAAHRPPTFYLRGDGLDTAPTPPEEEDMGQITDPEQIAALERIDNGIAALIDGQHKLDARVAALEGSVGTELDKHVGEVRRNVRRVGTAVKATGIEGTA